MDISGLALPALGIGELIQGRYSETGWIIASGEALSLLLLMDSVYQRGGQDDQVLYAASYIAFRIYEVYDVWFGALRHNKKVFALSLTLTPVSKSGALAVLSVRF